MGGGEATGMPGEAQGGGETGGGEAAGMSGEAHGLHETGVAAPDDPRLVPDRPLHDGRRTEDALPETEDMPPSLEDIQTGQSMGVDDVEPLAQVDRISPTTGGRGDVAGDAIVGGIEERVHGDPVSLVGGGRHAEVDSGVGHRDEAISVPDRDRREASRSLVVRTAVGPVVPHEAPFPIDPIRCAGGVASIVERRVGRGMCAPAIPPFAPSRERTQSRYVPQPRGTFAFGCMTAEELEAHDTMDYNGIDTGWPDLSWAPASLSLLSGGSTTTPSNGGGGPLSPPTADVTPRGSHTPRSG
ncbi:hypothetical protein CBR_g48282 [Chara braunii]|uniref:Uncharacterized protein n=1 Tax=Chara braunii TaxID=69332 RepID=A0A388M2G7_CHABU|nr:hypothetical protein CBR_g48282 [Chara braunii]|eukprot:GBG88754.1 hypothetical protein CBR_g48282 [Chara braunii]